jgi:hypothetical protein
MLSYLNVGQIYLKIFQMARFMAQPIMLQKLGRYDILDFTSQDSECFLAEFDIRILNLGMTLC